MSHSLPGSSGGSDAPLAGLWRPVLQILGGTSATRMVTKLATILPNKIVKDPKLP